WIGIILDAFSFRRNLPSLEDASSMKKGKLFLSVYKTILPWHLLLGGGTLLLGEAAFLIINASAHRFLFSHFMLSCFALAILIAIVDLFLALGKAKLLREKQSPLS
ncbi:MAG: hypothetical protein J6038_02965, partial [Bacilli bacterium]|nr:hypothetical protein [Bacilli bacterium]